MKRSIRVVALISAILILCQAFVGCSSLDEMEENHAFWFTPDKDVDSFGGKGIELDGNQYLRCNFGASPVFSMTRVIYVTNKNVPTPLSVTGHKAYISEDGYFIAMSDEEYGQRYFCRSDKYEEFAQKSEEITEKQQHQDFRLDGYCYIYEGDSRFYCKYYFLTEEEEALLDSISEVGESITFDPDTKADYSIMIYSNTDDKIFIEATGDCIISVDGTYYVYYRKGSTYRVPGNLTDSFDEIMKKYVESNGK